MNNKQKCIMLIDDNPDDNFYHERVIKKLKFTDCVIPMGSGAEALTYLKTKKEPSADLIFLDINMPGMNGWEFLEEYHSLDAALQHQVVIVMLTTSENADDKTKSRNFGFVSDFITKPLTAEKMTTIIGKYF